jgi:hypothetical protein
MTAAVARSRRDDPTLELQRLVLVCRVRAELERLGR